VMCLGTLFFPLMGSEGDGWHRAIIVAA
jgi:hypothetical protein